MFKVAFCLKKEGQYTLQQDFFCAYLFEEVEGYLYLFRTSTTRNDDEDTS